MPRLHVWLQVAGVRLKSGGQVEASLVLVGVGARPNVELFKGQLDLLEKAPGGIKVNSRLQVRLDGGQWGGQGSCNWPGGCWAGCQCRVSWEWKGYKAVCWAEKGGSLGPGTMQGRSRGEQGGASGRHGAGPAGLPWFSWLS